MNNGTCIVCEIEDVRNERSNLCQDCFDKALEEKVVEQPQASWF